MTTVPPLIALLALAGSIALPVGLNLGLWRRDRRMAKQLAAHAHLPAPFGPDEPTPRVSFLVAAWNEAGMIERCIAAVAGLAYPDVELVLCAGGADGTFALAARYANDNLKVIEQQPGEGKQHALQRCLDAATGSIIYLTDADCIITDETFRQCLAPILREGETVVTGSFYWPLPEQWGQPFVMAQVAVRAYTAAYQTGDSKGLLGGNCVLSRDALVAAGRFTNPVRTGTDYDLALRLRAVGQHIRYVAEASIQSEFPTKLQSYFRQQARWIRNVVLHGLPHHDYDLVVASARTSIVGLLMLLGLPVVIGLDFWHGYFELVSLSLTLLWLASFVHALSSRVRYQYFTARWFRMSSIRHIPWQLPAFVLLDFVAWSIPLLEYPFQRLRAQW